MASETPPYAIGCDVGVTHLKLAAVTSSGEVLTRRQTGTCADRPDWPGRVRDAIAATERDFGPAGCVGLAAPGIAAPDGRCIWWMQGRLSEVQGLDWSQFLGRSVPVLNDAQAALLGEAWLGAAKGSRNVLLLTLGTGVGGAAMVDGRLLKGHLGRAGHAGHISLDPHGSRDIANTPGSLEDRVGNATIAARTNGRFSTTHDLVVAAESGDASARSIWLETVELLAAGIASLINVLDPEVLVIGGGIARAGVRVLGAIRASILRHALPAATRDLRIELSAVDEEVAGVIGAAQFALDQLFSAAQLPTLLGADSDADPELPAPA
jgi:glucokinase